MTALAERTIADAGNRVAGEIVRDILRGGIAGGLVAGIGGRLVVVLGALITVPPVLGFLFGDRPRVLVGLAFLVSGGATLAWWWLQWRGQTDPPRTLQLAGQGRSRGDPDPGDRRPGTGGQPGTRSLTTGGTRTTADAQAP